MPDKLALTPEDSHSHSPGHQDIVPDEQNNNQFIDNSEIDENPVSLDTMPADDSHGSQVKELMKQYEAGEIGIEKLMAVCEKGLGRMSIAAAEKVVGIEIENEKKPDKGPTGAELLAKKQADRAALKTAQEVNKAPKMPQPKKNEKPLYEKTDLTKIHIIKHPSVVHDITNSIVEQIENTKLVANSQPVELARKLAVEARSSKQIHQNTSKTVNTEDIDNIIKLRSQPAITTEIIKICNPINETSRMPKVNVKEEVPNDVLKPISQKGSDAYQTPNEDSEVVAIIANPIAFEADEKDAKPSVFVSPDHSMTATMSSTEDITYPSYEFDNPETDIENSLVYFENNNYDQMGADLDIYQDPSQTTLENPVLNLDTNILTELVEDREATSLFEPAEVDETKIVDLETTVYETDEGIDIKAEIINYLPIAQKNIEPANQQIIDRFSELIIDKIDNYNYKKIYKLNESIGPDECNQATIINQLKAICGELLFALGLPNNDEDTERILGFIFPISNENIKDLPNWSQRIFTDSEGDHERLTNAPLRMIPVANIIHGLIGRLALGFKLAA